VVVVVVVETVVVVVVLMVVVVVVETVVVVVVLMVVVVMVVVAAHTRSLVGVGSASSSSCPSTHVVTGEHVRSLVGVGSSDSHWEVSSHDEMDAQDRSVVGVSATSSYSEVLQSSAVLHSRCEEGVGGICSNWRLGVQATNAAHSLSISLLFPPCWSVLFINWAALQGVRVLHTRLSSHEPSCAWIRMLPRLDQYVLPAVHTSRDVQVGCAVHEFVANELSES